MLLPLCHPAICAWAKGCQRLPMAGGQGERLPFVWHQAGESASSNHHTSEVVSQLFFHPHQPNTTHTFSTHGVTLPRSIPASQLPNVLALADAAYARRHRLSIGVVTALARVIAVTGIPLLHDTPSRGSEVHESELSRLVTLLLNFAAGVGEPASSGPLAAAAVASLTSLLNQSRKGVGGGGALTHLLVTPSATAITVELYATHARAADVASRAALAYVLALSAAGEEAACNLLGAGLLSKVEDVLATSASASTEPIDDAACGPALLIALSLLHRGGSAVNSGTPSSLLDSLIGLVGRTASSASASYAAVRNNAIAALLQAVLMARDDRRVGSSLSAGSYLTGCQSLLDALVSVADSTAGGMGTSSNGGSCRLGGTSLCSEVNCEATLLAWNLLVVLSEGEEEEGQEGGGGGLSNGTSAACAASHSLTSFLSSFLDDAEMSLRDCWTTTAHPGVEHSATTRKWSPQQWRRLTGEAVSLLTRLSSCAPPALHAVVSDGAVELACDLLSRASLRLEAARSTASGGGGGGGGDGTACDAVSHEVAAVVGAVALLTALCERTSIVTRGVWEGAATSLAVLIGSPASAGGKGPGLNAASTAALVAATRRGTAIPPSEGTQAGSISGPVYAMDSEAVLLTLEAGIIPLVVGLLRGAIAGLQGQAAGGTGGEEFPGSTSTTTTSRRLQLPTARRGRVGAAELHSIAEATMLLLSKLDMGDLVTNAPSSTAPSLEQFAPSEFRSCGGIEVLMTAISLSSAPSSRGGGGSGGVGAYICSEESGGGQLSPPQQHLLLAALGTARALVLPDEDSVSEFVAQGGAAALWDLVDSDGPAAVVHTALALLCDALRHHPAAVSDSTSMWRSMRTNRRAVEVLLDRWRLVEGDGSAAAFGTRGRLYCAIQACWTAAAAEAEAPPPHSQLAHYQRTVLGEVDRACLLQVCALPAACEAQAWRRVQTRLGRHGVPVFPEDAALLAAAVAGH